MRRVVENKMCFITGCILLTGCLVVTPCLAQKDVKQIRKGNQYFENKEFNQSEVSYRKALEVNDKSLKARFNLADALYKQGRFKESSDLLSDIASSSNDPAFLAGIYHNLGNSLLKEQKLNESIDAYKNSLRLNPADDETRYNLAYAQALMKEQQNQQNQKNNQDKKNQDKNKQDQNQNKDKQDQNQEKEKQEQQNKQDKQDQQNQEKQANQPNGDKKQEGKQGLSKEEAERLLQAAMNDEKKTRDKMSKQQFRAKKVRTAKAW